MKTTIMKCGHTAMAIDGEGRPYCVICHGDPRSEIVDTPPDLTGRLAKCGCGNTRESSIELAFFEYKGPNSYASQNTCKLCKYHLRAHLPKWEYRIVMVRDWFKHKKMNDDKKRTEHLPSREIAEKWAEKDIKCLLTQKPLKFTSGESRGKDATKIYEAKLDYIKGPLPSGCGHGFVPHGPYKYDNFYCGHSGWD